MKTDIVLESKTTADPYFSLERKGNTFATCSLVDLFFSLNLPWLIFLCISFHSVVQIFFTMMPSFLKLFKNDTKMAIWYDHDQMFFSAIEMYTALSWSVLLGHKSIGTYPWTSSIYWNFWNKLHSSIIENL